MEGRRVALLCGVIGAIGAIAIAVACGREGRSRSGHASPIEKTDRRLVLVVSIDGLRRDYLDDKNHSIPTLRRLAAEGAVARSLLSIWPSVTYPAHATLVTGVVPTRHGILNNGPFDPKGDLEGAWYWHASALRAPALWDVAEDAGIPVATIAWPVTVGARSHWNIPQIWKKVTDEDDALVARHCSPGLADELRAAGLMLPAEHRSDAPRVQAAIHVLAKHDPGLAFVYLTDLDNAQHDKGPGSPEAWTMLETKDRELGAIVEMARLRTSHLTVVVVSDHGFAPVSREVRPNVALRNAGLLDVEPRGPDDEKIVRWTAATWKAGGAAAILVQPDADVATRDRIRALFTDLAKAPENGIGAVHDGAAIERAGGFTGAFLVLEARDGFLFGPGTKDPFVGPTNMRGHHGWAPSRPDMAATLVLSGEGVRPGAALGDIAMIDVAPTIAALLGLRLPSAEGKPIADALTGAR